VPLDSFVQTTLSAHFLDTVLSHHRWICVQRDEAAPYAIPLRPE